MDHHVAAQRDLSEVLVEYPKQEQRILDLLGDDGASALHMCASGAEAIQSALFSHYFHSVRHTGNNHVLFSEGLPMQRMEEWGCATKPLPQGQITKDILLQAIKPRTGLLSISWAEPLTGVIHPLADLAEVCREKKIALHVDGTHVLGKLYFRLSDFPIDYFTFDGPLLSAPEGTGGLITKKNAPYEPLIPAKNPRHLTSITALAQALEDAARACDHMCLETARLRDQFERALMQALPFARVLFEEVERLPHISAIAFPGISAEALLYFLHRNGVQAAIGSLPDALSFSLSSETTEAEIDYAIETIIASVKRLKACSARIEEMP